MSSIIHTIEPLVAELAQAQAEMAEIQEKHPEVMAYLSNLYDRIERLSTQLVKLGGDLARERGQAGNYGKQPIAALQTWGGRRLILAAHVHRQNGVNTVRLYEHAPEAFGVDGVARVSIKGLRAAILAGSVPQTAANLIEPAPAKCFATWDEEIDQ